MMLCLFLLQKKGALRERFEGTLIRSLDGGLMAALVGVGRSGVQLDCHNMIA